MIGLKARLEKLENSILNKCYETTHFDQYLGETLKEALERFNKKSGNNFSEKEVKAKWSLFYVSELGTIWHHPNFSHSKWVIEQEGINNEKL